MSSVSTLENSPYPAWVNSSINHEMKAVVALALWTAGEPLTDTQLFREINILQGSIIPISIGSPQQFCSQSLEPAGFTEKTTAEFLKFGTKPMTARGDRLTEYGQVCGIPLLVDVADWSLKTPGLTLGQVMGVTMSQRTEKGRPHGTTRLDILRKLAASGASAVSDLSEESEEKIVSATITEMESEGIVDVSRSQHVNERTFQIVNPEYRLGESQKPFHKLKTETQLYFRVLKIARVTKDTWSFADFLRLAEAVDDDPLLLAKLNKLLGHQLAPSIEHQQYNVRNISGPVHKNGEKRTTVKLHEEHKDSVQEFVQIVESHIRQDSGAITKGADKALAIVSDQDKVAELIAKPRRKSALVHKDPHFDEKLAAIVNEADKPLTSRQIHAEYEQLGGRKVAVHTVTIQLWDLVKSGTLQAANRRPAPGKTLATPIYFSN